MPGPMTHFVFYQKLKEKLEENEVRVLDTYDEYSVFAQGHDLLLYQCRYNLFDEKKLYRNICLAKKLQEYNFVEFVYEFLKNAKEQDVLHRDSVKLFIGPGYIGHHILDMYTHPLIIFYSGDLVRTNTTQRWNHGIAENLIDIYVAENWIGDKLARYPVARNFCFKDQQFDDELESVLDKTLKSVYGYEDAGKAFRGGCLGLHWFMKNFKYDKFGVKRIIFDFMERFIHGLNSFSYNRKLYDVEKYINSTHQLWHNPMNPNITSTKSFEDLYKQALEHTVQIVKKLYVLIDGENIDKKMIEDIIPNRASTHGLECGKELVIRMTNDGLL